MVLFILERAFFYLAICRKSQSIPRLPARLFGESRMYKRAFSALQIINVIVHGIFTLIFQIALGLFAGWLFVDRLGAPSFVYVITILVGVGSGLFSMISFLISSLRTIERLEGERSGARKAPLKYKSDAYSDVDGAENE